MAFSHPAVFKVLWALVLLAAPALAGEVWTRGGPPGGVVTALVASPRDPDVLFAGTDGGGVFLGMVSDGAAVWSPLGSEVVGERVQALAVAPSAPDIIYVSVGEIPFVSGVWKSTDRGATWTAVNGGLPSSPPFCSCRLPIYALAVHPRNPDVVYAGIGGGGVYKTIDGGRRWFPAGTQSGGLSSVRSLLIDPAAPATVYAGASEGVYKSTNGGTSWTYVSRGLRERAVTALLLDPENRQVVFAATRTGVFRSLDAGLHWRLVGEIPQVLSLAAVAGIGPAPSTVWAGTRAGVWRSLDGGSTWRRAGGALRNLPVGALAVSPAQPHVVWAGMGNVALRASLYGPGVFRSADAGTTWRVANRGLFAARITSIGVSPGHPGAVLGTAGAGVFFKEGTGWVARNQGLTQLHVFSVERDPVDPEVVYAGTALGVFKTVNGGQGWESRNAGLTIRPLGVGGVRDIIIDPTVPEVVYAAVNSYIFRSDDGGATWTRLPATTTAFMEDLALDPGDPRVIYAAIGILFRSTDGGSTWTSPPVPPGEAVLAVTVDEAGRLFVGSLGNVLRSADGGETWEVLPLPVELTVQVQTVTVGSSPEQIWAGTSRGLYHSEDGGATWSLVQETRGASVTDVDVEVSGPGSVLAATLGAGLFERREGE